MLNLAHIQFKPLRWLWPHHFPLGKLSLLVGEQSAGKSFVALDIAARVSAGLPWPTLPDQATEPGGVLLLTEAEDLPDVTLPRLEAAGANLARIMVDQCRLSLPERNQGQKTEPNLDPPETPNPMEDLEQAIKNTPDCRLVIIDPLSAFLPESSSRKKPDLPAVFKQLAALAARTGVAIIAVTSFIASTSAATNHRAVATLASLPGPTCVRRVAADPQDPERRLLTPVKNNLAPRNAPLAFELASTPDQPAAKVVWKETSNEADRPTATRQPPPLRLTPAPPAPTGEPAESPAQNQEQAIAAATTWLIRRLTTCGGELMASRIRSGAAYERIPPHILSQAKARALIHATPAGSPGDELWKLP